MQFTYDPANNVAYLRLRAGADATIETIRLSDEINIDLAPDGSVYGIELLNANVQLRATDGGRLMLDFGEQHIEVPLPEPV